MSETKYEVAQIREIIREVGRFGGIMRMLFVAERTSPDGSETIAMSSEFEWQKNAEHYDDEDIERTRRTLHNHVLQALLAEGWEPIGTDGEGRVMALRRELPQRDDEAHAAETFSWKLTHPWRTK